MNKAQALAVSKAIWRYLRRHDGYQPFGYDWVTLHMTHPRIAAQLSACYRILRIAEHDARMDTWT